MPAASSPASSRILIYVLRRDLRLADNPIFHHASKSFAAPSSDAASNGVQVDAGQRNKQKLPKFTHLLPLYIFPAKQIEVSGFIPEGSKATSPYPQARSEVGSFWRCGPHRAKFVAESVFDLKDSLQAVGSGLTIRAGTYRDVLKNVLQSYKTSQNANGGEGRVEVVGVCMTKDVGSEERQQDAEVRNVAQEFGVQFSLWEDEKYYVDSQDLPYSKIAELPDVFTSFRKQVEPLRDQPRPALPSPKSLPPLPSSIPPQQEPFVIPDTLEEVSSCLTKPLDVNLDLLNPPQPSPKVKSGHPFAGGSRTGQARIEHLINSGAMADYQDTRNGLLGKDYSTKLSAWLAVGAITARQVHWAMYNYEEGKGQLGANSKGYGKGENKGTRAVRFELLWRDYMRLSAEKEGASLFLIDGSQKGPSDPTRPKVKWGLLEPGYKTSNRQIDEGSAGPGSGGGGQLTVGYRLGRFLNGTTGTSLIDAASRELFHTGYVSNRARQNVASYLAKHLGIDWRLGAEWYETLLVDYDVASNWGNWQYVAGVGNDPRQERVFNPIKQAFDYDSKAEYVKAWIPELDDIDIPDSGREREVALMNVFQPWRLLESDKQRLKVQGKDWAEHPIIRFNFDPAKAGRKRRGKGGGGGGPGSNGNGNGHGNGRGGGGRGGARNGSNRGAIGEGKGFRKQGERTWRRNGQVDRMQE